MKLYQKIKYMTGVLAVCLVVLLFSMQTEAAASKTVQGICNYDDAYQVLKQVNKERSKAGVGSLTMDKELLDAAMMRAAECTVDFSHTRPNGTDCFTASGKMYGENIALGYGTPEAVMKGWMNSEGHKKNILNKEYNSIGIGCFVINGSKYWVQCFGFVKAESVSNPGNCKSVYRVSLSASEETVLVKTGEENGNSLQSGISGFKVKAGKKKLTLTWKKKKGVDGYRIQISTDKAFKKSQTYTVKSGITKKTIKKYKGKRLKTGKKYYVRICAYIKGTGANRERRYSKWQSISRKVK
ncbi:MAG: CAP domain-containing protein [Lachnospiraceae bacterium]|nr:CAP domain-containing protein [Lachnospiraceae bacterium]